LAWKDAPDRLPLICVSCTMTSARMDSDLPPLPRPPGRHRVKITQGYTWLLL
jgi:hypothetical protein